MSVKNQVQLITYPDSLGGDIKSLEIVLNKHFADVFCGGIHLLPPYPSSGDRGFAPRTYFEIDPKFGSWEDVKRLGEQFDIMIDVMVNHISQRSDQFQEYLKLGQESPYADWFLPLDKIWPDGIPVQSDIDLMVLRRKVPYSEFSIGGDPNKTQRLWTTFGKTSPSEQIDLDVRSPAVKGYFLDILNNFARNNIKGVRLDAVSYIVKRPGTDCYFVEPDIYDFMNWIQDAAASLGMEVLPEVHAHHAIKSRLSEHGFWNYDFILPGTVLDTIFFRRHTKLYEYLKDRSAHQFTMLDCHDGIPIKPDLDGLIDESTAAVAEKCLERGALATHIINTVHKEKNGFDVHQIQCTFYSVLGCDDDAYIAARAIQFFVPGIPQVYYVGMLAGENDTKAAEASRENRDINRYNYTMVEIDEAMQKEVVKRLVKLIRLRNTATAFNGKFSALPCPPDEVQLQWTLNEDSCLLKIDLNTYSSTAIRQENGCTEEITL